MTTLNERQRAVLDLVCEDFSYKEIAHRLKVSVRTVEQRMASVRITLGTYDRPSTARAYRHLKMLCGQTTYGLHPLDSEVSCALSPQSDAGLGPVFTLSDAGISSDVWVTGTHPDIGPRDDELWGKIYRFGMIVVIALGIAAGLAALIATINGLNDLL